MNEPARKSRSGARASVTIKDVARYAGVSPMTVSRVVNGGQYVSDATRQTVMQAVRRLGYSPNLAARNLASARGERMGLLCGGPSAAYLSEFLVGALDAATRHGLQFVLEKCEMSSAAARGAVRRLLAGGVNGVVLPPPLCESAVIHGELRAARMRIAAVGAARPPADLMSVGIDEFAAAREMTRYLLALGHRRLGFIKGHPNRKASEQRWRGFTAAVDEHGHLPPPRLEQGFSTFRSGLDAARRLLLSTPLPTAIFASSDDMAAAVMAEAHRHGLEVPNDLTVVGFDDSLIAAVIWPGLTTIHQPIAQMAGEAVDLLVEAVRGGSRGAVAGPVHRLFRCSMAAPTRIDPSTRTAPTACAACRGSSAARCGRSAICALRWGGKRLRRVCFIGAGALAPPRAGRVR